MRAVPRSAGRVGNTSDRTQPCRAGRPTPPSAGARRRRAGAARRCWRCCWGLRTLRQRAACEQRRVKQLGEAKTSELKGHPRGCNQSRVGGSITTASRSVPASPGIARHRPAFGVRTLTDGLHRAAPRRAVPALYWPAPPQGSGPKGCSRRPGRQGQARQGKARATECRLLEPRAPALLHGTARCDALRRAAPRGARCSLERPRPAPPQPRLAVWSSLVWAPIRFLNFPAPRPTLPHP